MSLDTEILIIGAGPSGMGLGIQLIRQLGKRNFLIVEKTGELAGTWSANSYPGCGCDVPSHFYSYSFALNPNWSLKFSMQPEIKKYFQDVADQYDIPRHIRFNTAVEKASWDEVTGTWLVEVRDQHTKETQQLRSKILVSAVGSLSTPKDCDIPGAEEFQGRIFHSAAWDHCFDYTDKEVVCVGNGCSATQFVPIMSAPGPNSVKKLTQFSRQAHWLSERPNPAYTPAFKALLRWVPGFMRLYRWLLFAQKEREYASLELHGRGEKMRDAVTREVTQYIRAHAPARYADALVPRTVLGCKRRVMDTGYLAALHRDTVELVPDDPIARLCPTGVVTASGRHVRADAVVLATGFKTHQPLFPMDVRGAGGVALADHWRAFGDGSPEAYYGTCLSGFPNFFVLMGPNTVSGHLSVLFTSEAQINWIVKVVRPVLRHLSPPSSLLSGLLPWGGGEYPDVVAVTPEAERRDVEWVQSRTKQLVWSTGCASWGVDERTGRNTMLYPDWQWKYYVRSVFVKWADLAYSWSKAAEERRTSGQRRAGAWQKYVVLLACAGTAAALGGRYADPAAFGKLGGELEALLRWAVPQSLRG